MRATQGLPGGAQAALTTSEAAVDLSALKGRTVLIWADADIWFTFSADGVGTLVTAGASAASLTSLKAKRLRAGRKAARLIENAYPYVIVKAVTGTGTLHVEVASAVDGSASDGEEATAPALGTVTVGDGTGPLTVDGTVATTDTAWTTARQGALAASYNARASAGRLAAASGRIDKTAPSGDYFIQIFDATTATGTPVASVAITHVNGVHSQWNYSAQSKGASFATGITFGLSSTEDTHTGAGSYLKVASVQHGAA